MILAIGITLFRQRLQGWSHDHGGGGHTHEIPRGISLRSLTTLGMSGGILPCPSALVVLLSAVALHRVGVGLLFILSFSLGLASVLVAVGILVVRASRFLPRPGSGRWTRALPVLSAAIISVIGLGVALDSISGTGIANPTWSIGGGAAAFLGLGLLLGLKHATDADHIVAVTTFVSREPGLLRSCWVGVFWGLGHTLSLAAAGLIVIGLRVNIPEWLSARLELGVAAMLVLLGAHVVIRTFRGIELHGHSSAHAIGAVSGHTRRHFHPFGAQAHADWRHIGFRPLLVGAVHGAAGSAALMLLVLSTIRSAFEAFLYILIFGFGSIVGMLAISLLLAVPLKWAKDKVGASYRPVQVAAGLFSCVFGLYLGMEIWNSLP